MTAPSHVFVFFIIKKWEDSAISNTFLYPANVYSIQSIVSFTWIRTRPNSQIIHFFPIIYFEHALDALRNLQNQIHKFFIWLHPSNSHKNSKVTHIANKFNTVTCCIFLQNIFHFNQLNPSLSCKLARHCQSLFFSYFFIKQNFSHKLPSKAL